MSIVFKIVSITSLRKINLVTAKQWGETPLQFSGSVARSSIQPLSVYNKPRDKNYLVSFSWKHRIGATDLSLVELKSSRDKVEEIICFMALKLNSLFIFTEYTSWEKLDITSQYSNP